MCRISRGQTLDYPVHESRPRLGPDVEVYVVGQALESLFGEGNGEVMKSGRVRFGRHSSYFTADARQPAGSLNLVDPVAFVALLIRRADASGLITWKPEARSLDRWIEA